MSEWIEWGGGSNPAVNKVVEVRFSNGEINREEANDYSWTHVGSAWDIIAYRLSTQEEAYEETDKPIGDSALNRQFGGDHYSKLGDYQPWEVLRRWLTPEEFRGYMKGTAITYLARERDKGGTQDIEKAMHTLQGLIELEAK